jgi:acrylyl-CoA reductase (NADPH)
MYLYLKKYNSVFLIYFKIKYKFELNFKNFSEKNLQETKKMLEKKFKALVTEEIEPNNFQRSIKEKSISELPEGEVLIEVHYSSLNYKDALSARGHKGITRNYPHTPGIDASGIVASSLSPEFNEGDRVLVTGYDLGMNTDGGFGQYIRVPAGWIVRLPDKISLKEAMMYGTAGFTAAICIWEITYRGITPNYGKVLVTGATGGVGSFAIAILSKIGYDVVCSTLKTDQFQYLKEIGAETIISSADVNDQSGKPLLSGRWSAVIENLGGNTLSSAIRSTKLHGAVCCLGNVTGDMLETSIYPFLLRGVTIFGIDSAEKPMDLRLKIWKKIFNEWRIEKPERMIREVGLDKLSVEIDRILAGAQIGRVIVNLKDQ